MKYDGEKQIRTTKYNMLLCTSVKDEDGEIVLIVRSKGKEERMSLTSFLYQVYSESENNPSK